MKSINEIEEFVDNLNTNKKIRSRRRIRIRNKKMVAGVFAVFIACTLIATGALLTYFGQVTTTAQVGQSIQISGDGEQWHDFDDGIETTIPGEGLEMIHCTPYWYKYWIRNRACADADVYFQIDWLNAPGGSAEGYDVRNYIIGGEQTIELRHKDNDWNIIGEQGANLTINNCGKMFWYNLEFFGYDRIGEPNGYDYALIYYIDQDPRFDVWGKYMLIDFVTLGIDKENTFEECTIPAMPFIDDWNAVVGGYTYEDDGYEHIQGAKFWLIPKDEVDVTEPGTISQMTILSHALYLFETDLGLYVKCDAEPLNYPHIYDLFQVYTIKSETSYCWLNYNHVPMDIWPGIYRYRTRLQLGTIR